MLPEEGEFHYEIFLERGGKLSCETFVLMKKLFFPPPELSFLGFSQQKQLILHHRLALHLIGVFIAIRLLVVKKVNKLCSSDLDIMFFLCQVSKKLGN